MDFVHDQLADGRKLRTLTVIDLYTRECLAIEVGYTLRAEQVVTAMRHLSYERGRPQRISCDNGSEFSGGQMDLWAYTNQVQMDFNRRGKPTDNAFVESFNGKFREECLNAHWFESVEDAKEKIDAWRWDYNEHRPHRSLEGLTPRGICGTSQAHRGRKLTALVVRFYPASQAGHFLSHQWTEECRQVITAVGRRWVKRVREIEEADAPAN
jgi:hypothetical protein